MHVIRGDCERCTVFTHHFWPCFSTAWFLAEKGSCMKCEEEQVHLECGTPTCFARGSKSSDHNDCLASCNLFIYFLCESGTGQDKSCCKLLEKLIYITPVSFSLQGWASRRMIVRECPVEPCMLPESSCCRANKDYHSMPFNYSNQYYIQQQFADMVQVVSLSLIYIA